MRLADAYPEIPALVFRAQTRYRTVWRGMRRRIDRWALQHVEQGGVVASALGAVGLDYVDLGLNTYGSSSMPLTHIRLADLCAFCEVSGLTLAELLPIQERGLTAHERGELLALLARARSALLEIDPSNALVPEISRTLDLVTQPAPAPLLPKEEPTPELTAARLPFWMRQRI